MCPRDEVAVELEHAIDKECRSEAFKEMRPQPCEPTR